MPYGKIASNNKCHVLQRKSWRKHRIRKAERIRRQGGHVQGDIADPELITIHMLKKRRTSPRTNITLSGKKKRKLIKRLKHSQPKQVKSTDVEMETVSSKKKRTKKTKVKEVEMEEEEEEVEEEEASQGDEEEEEEMS